MVAVLPLKTATLFSWGSTVTLILRPLCSSASAKMLRSVGELSAIDRSSAFTGSSWARGIDLLKRRVASMGWAVSASRRRDGPVPAPPTGCVVKSPTSSASRMWHSSASWRPPAVWKPARTAASKPGDDLSSAGERSWTACSSRRCRGVSVWGSRALKSARVLSSASLSVAAPMLAARAANCSGGRWAVLLLGGPSLPSTLAVCVVNRNGVLPPPAGPAGLVAGCSGPSGTERTSSWPAWSSTAIAGVRAAGGGETVHRAAPRNGWGRS